MPHAHSVVGISETGLQITVVLVARQTIFAADLTVETSLIVTSVRLRLFPANLRRVRAVGSLVFDRCFQIEHIHVVQREDGTLLVAMPSRYEADSYHDVAHPITAGFRREVDVAVLEEYARLVRSRDLTEDGNSVTIRP